MAKKWSKKEIEEYIGTKQISQENYVAPVVETNYVPREQRTIQSVANTVDTFNNVNNNIKQVQQTVQQPMIQQNTQNNVTQTTTQQKSNENIPKENKFSFSIDDKKTTESNIPSVVDKIKEIDPDNGIASVYDNQDYRDYYNSLDDDKKKEENDKVIKILRERATEENTNTSLEFLQDKKIKKKLLNGEKLTDEEQKKYNNLNKANSNKILMDYVNDYYKDANKKTSTVEKIVTAPVKGVKELLTGPARLIGYKQYNREDGKAQYLPDAMDIKSERVKGDIDSKLGRFAYDVTEGAAPIVVSSIVPGAESLYWTSMYGNNYKEAVNNLTSQNKDNNGEAILNAGIKTSFEFLTGKLLGSATKKLTGGTASELEKALSNKAFTSKILQKLPENMRIKVANIFGSTFSEGTEEGIQTYLENLTDIITLGSDGKHDNVMDMLLDPDVFGDAMYSALVGGATGGTLSSFNGTGKETINKTEQLNIFRNAIQEDLNNTTDTTKKEKLQNILNNIDNSLKKPFSIENENIENIAQTMDENKVGQLSQNKPLEQVIREDLAQEEQQTQEQPIQTPLNTLNQGVQQEINQTPYETQTPQITPLNQVNQELQETRQNDIADSVKAMNLEKQPEFKQKEGNYVYEKSDNSKIDTFRKDAATYLKAGEQTDNFVKTLEKIIEDKGIEIRFDPNLRDSQGRMVNGSYSNNVITLNPNSNRAGEFLAIHELTHAIGTKSMINMIQKYRQSNAEFDSAVKRLLTTYKAPEINEEALGDIAGQLFGNQEYINNLSMENPSLFKRIYNEIKYLWHQFRGYKNQNQFIEDLRNKWESAYRNQKVQQTTKTGYSLEERVSGDKLLDTQDLINEIKDVGAEVDDNGYVTVYHQTTDENAQKIRETGQMISKEPSVFFSTSKNASQSDGRGTTKLEFKIPAEELELDDLFSDNADVKIRLNGKNSLDVSNYLIDNTQDMEYNKNDPEYIGLIAARPEIEKYTKYTMNKEFLNKPIKEIERISEAISRDSIKQRNKGKTQGNYYDIDSNSIYTYDIKNQNINYYLNNITHYTEEMESVYEEKLGKSNGTNEEIRNNRQSNLLVSDGKNQNSKTISTNDELLNTNKEFNRGTSNEQSNRNIKELDNSSFSLTNINKLTDDGITMTYVRNPNSNASQYKNLGQDFGQDLEPSGEYMNMDTLEGKNKIDGLEYGTIQFKNPLIIDNEDTTSKGWKKELSERYKGLTGKKLSNAIMQDGYDAVMSRDADGNIWEVVNLNGVKQNKTNTKFSKEENNDLRDRAKEELGTTTNLNEAGYLTNDGNYLDFSGKKQGARGGSRQMDHREVSDIYSDEEYDNAESKYPNMGSATAILQDFMDRGNIRLNNTGVEISVPPTAEQYDKLYDYLEHVKEINGDVFIDLDTETNNRENLEYNSNISVSKMIKDIKNHYESKYSKDNATWREYLEKEFTSQGTRTNLQDINERNKPKQENKTTQEEKPQETPKKEVKKSFLNSKEQEELNGLKDLYETGLMEETDADYKRMQELEKKQQGITTKFPELKKTVTQDDTKPLYFKYKNNEISKENRKILNEAKKIVESNKQNRRTKEQWLQVAEYIGANANVKSSQDLQRLAMETWLESKPNNRENLNRQGKKYIEFKTNEWFNAMYKGAGVGTDVKMSLEETTDNKGKKVDLKPTGNNVYEKVNTKPKKNEIISKDDIVNEVLNIGDKKVSNFYSNATEKSKFITEENRVKLMDNDTLKYYDAINNKETLQDALNKLDSNTENQIGDFFTKKEFTAEDVATGWILVKRYQDAGNFEAMSNVIERMRQQGTKAGQTIQMYGMLERLTPEGMEYYSQKQLDNAFNEFSKNKSKKQIEKYANDFTLTAEEHQFIKDTMEKVQKMTDDNAKKVEIAKIVSMLSDKLPPEKGSRLKSWMRISMLGNPKTQVRNIVGNAIIQPVNWVGDVFSSVADKLVSKKTGVRTKGATDFGALARGTKQGFKESIRDAKLGIDTRDINLNRFEENIGAKPFYEKHTGAAKVLNPVAKGLNKVNKILGNVMSGGDRVFYQGIYENSLQNQMKLNKVEVPTQEMIDIATQEALQRTWNDSNEYTKAVLQIRNAMNKLNVKGYGLGDVLIPFAKTPANLTKAIVDYSPVGLARTILKDGRNLKNSLQNGQYNAQLQHKFADSLGKGFAGSLLWAAAYGLAQAGITSGASDDDKDVANFMRNTLGIQPYSVKIGDKSFTYDWAQPIAAPFAAMADYKRLSERENEELGDIIKTATSSASNILLEQSFLSSIQDVFNSYNGPSEAIKQQIEDLPARATPTFFKQIADLIDPKSRQTYVKGDASQTLKNKVQVKIPGASKELTAQRDTLGREIEKYGGNDNTLKYAFNVFLNPANTNKGKPSEAAEEIYAVYKATGDKTIMPRQVGYSENIGGTTRNLTAKERNEWQKLSGEKIEENVKALIQNDKYNEMSNEDKAAVINGIVNYSFAKAKSDLFNTNISTIYKTAAKKEEQGIPLYDYYIDRISKRK